MLSIIIPPYETIDKKNIQPHRKIEFDSKTIRKMFKKSTINNIAKTSSFIQRERKLEPYEFFLSLTFGSLRSKTITLSSIVENMSSTITRAGVHERFDENAYNFIHKIYSHIFKEITQSTHTLDVKLLNKFNRINIIDSSSWRVPQRLKETFPGYNQAGCKVQLMMDYKSGIIQLLDITPENYNDQTYSKDITPYIKPDDLLIFDLGYAIPVTLKTIDENQAFFICRFNYHSMSLYLKENNTFQRIDILQKLTSSQSTLKLECYAGNNTHKVKLHLFAVRVPEQVANQRRRTLYRNAKKKGRYPTKKSLALCDWTLIMSNIPHEKELSVDEIFSFYPIRWSIELLFKQLKSILHIHKTEVKHNPYRLRCEIIGKCIVALFISYCYAFARSYTWQLSGTEISFEKTIKYFQRNIGHLLVLFSSSLAKAIFYLKKMVLKIVHSCQKLRQISRKNSLDILLNQSVSMHPIYIELTQLTLTRTCCLT